MLAQTFSSKLDWNSYIVSIAKTASKKIGALIHSPEVAIYLYKSTRQPCMEYCCHVWTGSPSGIVRKPTKTDIQGRWSFTCCLS